MNIKDQLRNFIYHNFMYTNSGNGITDDQSFLDSGIIDSTGVLELVTFVEETFEINIEDDELIPENLDSVARVVAYVERKRIAAE